MCPPATPEVGHSAEDNLSPWNQAVSYIHQNWKLGYLTVVVAVRSIFSWFHVECGGFFWGLLLCWKANFSTLLCWLTEAFGACFWTFILLCHFLLAEHSTHLAQHCTVLWFWLLNLQKTIQSRDYVLLYCVWPKRKKKAAIIRLGFPFLHSEMKCDQWKCFL